jgi:hypothetical protein
MINFKRFTVTEHTGDRREAERVLSGRINKSRYKFLQRLCRVLSWRESCGHEHDCCGCLFMRELSLKVVNGQAVIVISDYFNY